MALRRKALAVRVTLVLVLIHVAVLFARQRWAKDDMGIIEEAAWKKNKQEYAAKKAGLPAMVVDEDAERKVAEARANGSGDGDVPMPRAVKHLKPTDVVMVVKTGVRTADRVANQLRSWSRNGTFWSTANMLVVGDGHFWIDQYEVIDVIAGLTSDPEIAEKPPVSTTYVEQQRLLAEGFDPATTAAQQSIPAGTNNEGWVLTAMVSIPSMQALYSKFPNAKWYVQIDDDTYLHTHNLLIWLDMLDPDQDTWTGGRPPGTDMIHGGGGSVYSNSVLRKRFGTKEQGGFGDPEYLQGWLRKPAERPLGDLMLTYSLMDENVTIAPQWGFKPFFGGKTPYEYGLDTRIACYPQLTWHHISDPADHEIMNDATAIDDTNENLHVFVDTWIRLKARQLRNLGNEQPYYETYASDARATRLSADLAMLRVYADDRWATDVLYFYPIAVKKWVYDPASSLVDRGAKDDAECARHCRVRTGLCVAWLWLDIDPDYHGQEELDYEEKPIPRESQCVLSSRVWLQNERGFFQQTASPPMGYKAMRSALNVDTLTVWHGRCGDNRWKQHMYTADVMPILRPEYRDVGFHLQVNGSDAWPTDWYNSSFVGA